MRSTKLYNKHTCIQYIWHLEGDRHPPRLCNGKQSDHVRNNADHLRLYSSLTWQQTDWPSDKTAKLPDLWSAVQRRILLWKYYRYGQDNKTLSRDLSKEHRLLLQAKESASKLRRTLRQLLLPAGPGPSAADKYHALALVDDANCAAAYTWKLSPRIEAESKSCSCSG